MNQSRFKDSLPLICLILLAFVLRLYYVWTMPFSYDEGHWLMFGALAAKGHPAYTETFVGIPPIALLTIQLGVMLFGYTLSTRLPVMLVSLVGIAAMYWLVRYQTKDNGKLAALLAATLFAFGPNYFIPSASIMAEVPALSLALLSVMLVETYRVRPNYLWLALSCAAFVLSLAFKVFVIFLPIIIFIQLLLVALNYQKAGVLHLSTYVKLFKLGCIWLGGCVIVLAILVIVFNPPAMYEQVIQFRLLLRDWALETNQWPQQNLYAIKNELWRYLPMLIVAGFGLFMVRKNWTQYWLWPVWFVVATLFLFTHIPLRPRHTVLVLPPLAALSGIALAMLGNKLPRPIKPYKLLFITVCVLCLLIFTVTTEGSIQITEALTQPNLYAQTKSQDLSAINYVQHTTSPNDCLVVDDQRFAFAANRLVTPFLSETSEARFRVGWLNPETITEDADVNDCPAMVFQTFRFKKSDLHKAAMSVYSLRLNFKDPNKPDETRVYAVQMNNQSSPSYNINKSLDNKILLKGSDLPQTAQVSHPLILSTYWQLQEKIDQDYKIFLQLRDAQGNVQATYDHYPFALSQDYLIDGVTLNPTYITEQTTGVFDVYPTTGLIPTRLWIPGNVLRETISLSLSDTIIPGTYSLYVGMYNETTLERLPVIEDSSGENAIHLGDILVE